MKRPTFNAFALLVPSPDRDHVRLTSHKPHKTVMQTIGPSPGTVSKEFELFT